MPDQSQQETGRVHRGGGLDLGSGDGLADREQRGRAEDKGHRQIRVLALGCVAAVGQAQIWVSPSPQVTGVGKVFC